MRISESNKSDRIKRLRKKAMALPLKPGVYIMHDKNGKIIYIGKAKILKNRVSQYFGSETNHTEKVRQMVANAEDFEYIICNSEFEALILECSLIKQNMPKYNILLKDDKGYHYIKITDGKFRTIKSALQKADDGATYIGPYSSGYVVKQNVSEVQNIFKLPHCGKEFKGNSKVTRPCLNYHIGVCSAPCAGKIPLSEYEKTVDDALEFLQSGAKPSVKQLTRQMQAASDNLDFETAAKLRDRIRALEKINEKQKVTFSVYKSQDIIAAANVKNKYCIELFVFRNSVLCDRKQFIINTNGDTPNEVRASFLKQYYTTRECIPKRIFIDEEPEDLPLIKELLSSIAQQNVEITVPKIGEQLKLTEMCRDNAYEYLTEILGNNSHEALALEELAKLLNLEKAPEYIESYDISHTFGADNVAGMVVFKDGKPLKSGYRKFKIKSFVGQDDCRSMRETVYRRFNEYLNAENHDEGFGKLPDLILLDGGIMQVNAVNEVLTKLNINVPVFGMVKDGKHKTNAVASTGGEILIKSNRAAYNLLYAVQEEVHRFAIGYHHNRAKKTMFNSELVNIPSVGRATAEKLLKHFRTLDAIKNADCAQIAAIKGVSKTAAENIFAYFHTEEN